MDDLDVRSIYLLCNEIKEQLKEINCPSGWLDIKQAVTYSACSKSTLLRVIHSGKLKSVKRGGKIRLKISWLDQWLLFGHSKRLTQIEKDSAGL